MLKTKESMKHQAAESTSFSEWMVDYGQKNQNLFRTTKCKKLWRAMTAYGLNTRSRRNRIIQTPYTKFLTYR